MAKIDALNDHMSRGAGAFSNKDWGKAAHHYTAAVDAISKLRNRFPEDEEKLKELLCAAKGQIASSMMNEAILSGTLSCNWNIHEVHMMISNLLDVYKINPQESYMLEIFGKLVFYSLHTGRMVGLKVSPSTTNPELWGQICKKGSQAIDHQNWGEAIHWYSQAIEIDGNHGFLFHELGLALFSQGNLLEGVKAFEKMQKLGGADFMVRVRPSV